MKKYRKTKRTEALVGKQIERKLQLDIKKANKKALTVPASLSSEVVVKKMFGDEILKHDKAAVNMEFAEREQGLPLLMGHDAVKLVGRVKDVKLINRRLKGTLHFSPNSEIAREAWADVQDEFLVDISISGSIQEARETVSAKRGQDPVIEITRWTPLEASIVSVAADPSVGINRSANEGRTMAAPKKSIKRKTPARRVAKPILSVAGFETKRSAQTTAGIKTGRELERTRVEEINTLFADHAERDGVPELRDEAIKAGITVKRAGGLLLQYLAGDDLEPITRQREQAPGSHGQRLELVTDVADKWVAGVTEALMMRGGLITEQKEIDKARKSEFHGMQLIELARNYLVVQRADMKGFDRQRIVGLAFTRAGMHGTSDFSNVLENVAAKSLLLGYNEAPETWATWARIGNLADFKIASRVNISAFSDLETVLESGEYKEGHMSDLKETIQLVKFGKLFHISREAIINDDLDAFTRIPRNMGAAANRKVGDIAYAILTDNATLNQDATALFAAGHNNLGTGGVITETTLDEFGRLMALQTSPAPAPGETGAKLNMAPKYLIHPRAINMTAQKVVLTPTAPVEGTNTGDLTINTQRNQWVLVWDSRLDADSAVQYYGLADQNLADTIEVAFLDGNQNPFLESEQGFTTDGVRFKVRLEAAASALDFRGAVRNAGA